MWDNSKASRLVESLLLNIPIPALYFAETSDGHYEIIDGHQRVRSIVRFLNNELQLSGLAVLTEHLGKRYYGLPDRDQRSLKLKTLRTIVIGMDSHSSMKFEIFERLNSGSIVLTSQELRNSLYRGTLNNLLKDLAHNQTFRMLIGTKEPRKRMVDEELILRFLALHANLPDYRPSLKRFLKDFFELYQNPSDDAIDSLTTVFKETTQRIYQCLGTNSFRIMDQFGKPIERGVNRSLFDSQMLAFSWIKELPVDPPKAAVEALSTLYENPDFLDAVRRATGDRTRTLTRIRRTVAALKGAGFRFDVPFDLEAS